MSCFIAWTYSDRIQLLTDGAAFNRQGNLTDARVCKIWSSDVVPLAVTGRGRWRDVQMLASTIVEAGETLRSVDDLMADYVPVYLAAFEGGPLESFDLGIAAWSETAGPLLYYAHSGGAGHRGQPFTLHPKGDIWAAAKMSPSEILDSATTSVNSPAFFENHGADIIDIVRKKPTVLTDPAAAGVQYSVGGHCQLTTVTSEGVETRTLREWDDKVGEPINPFSSALQELS